MSKLIGSEQELQELILSNKNVLVLFYASWCHYSQMFLPVFEEQAAEEGYCRVLTDELPGSADKYSIQTVPTVLFFHDGKLVRRLDGEPGQGLSRDQLTEMASACGMPAGGKTAHAAHRAKKQ